MCEQGLKQLLAHDGVELACILSLSWRSLTLEQLLAHEGVEARAVLVVEVVVAHVVKTEAVRVVLPKRFLEAWKQGTTYFFLSPSFPPTNDPVFLSFPFLTLSPSYILSPFPIFLHVLSPLFLTFLFSPSTNDRLYLIFPLIAFSISYILSLFLILIDLLTVPLLTYFLAVILLFPSL